jgi:heptosyltransferase-3
MAFTSPAAARRLLIRPGAIGDCILSLPALECLRAPFTEVWVPSPAVPLIRFADAVASIASTGLDLLGVDGVEPPRPLLARLRGFDSIVSWYGSNRLEFRRAVAALDLPFVFFHALPPPGAPEHCADYLLHQAGCPGRALPHIECPSATAATPFAVIHPFSGSARKNWPLDSFRELARRLPLPLPVAWCAGPEDNLPGARRFDDLYELARWLAAASLYIGNDSGITHLAAAVGAPVIAIFGPTDPALWAPRGPRVRVIQGNPTSGDVLRVVQEILDRHP